MKGWGPIVFLLVARILRGANPAEIPVEQPIHFERGSAGAARLAALVGVAVTVTARSANARRILIAVATSAAANHRAQPFTLFCRVSPPAGLVRHGTNQPSTIGTFVSSGCIRLTNEDVSDLYTRVQVGTRVVVLPGGAPPSAQGPSSVGPQADGSPPGPYNPLAPPRMR